MSSTRLVVCGGFVLGALAAPSLASANVGAGAPPKGGFNNSLSVGLSAGEVLPRDASFWGISIAYARRLPRGWLVDASIMWDRETEKKPMAPSVVIDSYTVAGTLGYSFSDRFALSAGAGKGFASNDNPGRSMRFQSGDLSVGMIGTLSTEGFRFWDRDSISFSLSWEYNVSQREPSISMDVVFAFSY